ncbi:MAG: hypothetical protein ACRYE9_03940, partial [Janthinobacterium lividum]
MYTIDQEFSKYIMTKNIKYTLVEFIGTFAYIGNIKYCPGTFGSLGAFPISYLLVYIVSDGDRVFPNSANFNNYQIITLFSAHAVVALILLI